jgi:hypothetical protein
MPGVSEPPDEWDYPAAIRGRETSENSSHNSVLQFVLQNYIKIAINKRVGYSVKWSKQKKNRHHLSSKPLRWFTKVFVMVLKNHRDGLLKTL